MVNACGLVPSLCSLGTTAHLQPIPTVQGRVYAASGAVGVADVDSEIPVSSQWQKKKRKDERKRRKRKERKKSLCGSAGLQSSPLGREDRRISSLR